MKRIGQGDTNGTTGAVAMVAVIVAISLVTAGGCGSAGGGGNAEQSVERTVSHTLAIPETVSPAQDSTQGTTVDFVWNEVAGAISYELHLGTSVDPALHTTTAATSLRVSGLAPGTHYYWKLVARGATASQTGVMGFLTNADTAGAPYPFHNATGWSTSVTLGWSLVDGASFYDLYFGTTTNPAFLARVRTNSFNPGALMFDKTYYWRVDAGNDSGSVQGETWSFKTAGGQVHSPGPSEASTEVSLHGTVLEWDPVPGAENYDVYFGTGATPTFRSRIETTTFDPGILLEGTTYHWRVDAVNARSVATGQVWTFTTESGFDVETGDNSPTDTMLMDGWEAVVLQAQVTGPATESAHITSISVTAAGCGADDTDITSVALVLDTDGDGEFDYDDNNTNGLFDLGTDTADGGAADRVLDAGRYFDTDNGTITFSGLSEIVGANGEMDLLVVYRLGHNLSDCKWYKATVTAIEATGVTTANSLDKTGELAPGSYLGAYNLQGFTHTGETTYTSGGVTRTVREYSLDLGGVTMEFVLIPGGTFQMGGTGADEGPVHEVVARPYLMAKYEVTREQWAAVMGGDPSHFAVQNGPVENLTWHEAYAFTVLTGLELPTEAQWEFAARAGTTGEWSFGSEALLASSGNTASTAPLAVGSRLPNAFGLYDMHGNVSEWTRDDYDANFYASAQASGVDPVNEGGTGPKVVRGGSWNDDANDARSPARQSLDAGDERSSTGFRPVLNLK